MPYKNREDLKIYQRQWMAKRRAAYLEDKRCERCGAATNLVVCTGSMAHRGIWSWSAERQRKLLARVRILCRDCRWLKEETNAGLQPADHVDATSR